MTLKGSTEAKTRHELINAAKLSAAQYYGTECVTVTLSDERCEQDYETNLSTRTLTASSFTADWEAELAHRWDQPTYGFAKCAYCKKEKPRSWTS